MAETFHKCRYHCDYGDGEYCHYMGESGCIYNKIEVTAESLVIPEPLRSFVAEPSADDVIGVTHCILCGESIPVHRSETFERRACEDCKRAFKRMKGKLPEED